MDGMLEDVSSRMLRTLVDSSTTDRPILGHHEDSNILLNSNIVAKKSSPKGSKNYDHQDPDHSKNFSF